MKLSNILAIEFEYYTRSHSSAHWHGQILSTQPKSSLKHEQDRFAFLHILQINTLRFFTVLFVDSTNMGKPRRARESYLLLSFLVRLNFWQIRCGWDSTVDRAAISSLSLFPNTDSHLHCWAAFFSLAISGTVQSLGNHIDQYIYICKLPKRGTI